MSKSNAEGYQNIISNQTFLAQYPEKSETVNTCMDGYKTKIQPDGSLEKLKLIILVRGDMQNKELVGDTWSPTASMRTLEYFLADTVNHKAVVHQLEFIGVFLHKKVKNRVFLKLDSRNAD